jgi:hypothetical protein
MVDACCGVGTVSLAALELSRAALRESPNSAAAGRRIDVSSPSSRVLLRV